MICMSVTRDIFLHALMILLQHPAQIARLSCSGNLEGDCETDTSSILM